MVDALCIRAFYLAMNVACGVACSFPGAKCVFKVSATLHDSSRADHFSAFVLNT